MTTVVQPVWMTRDAYDRARIELAALRAEGDRDPSPEFVAAGQRARRIRALGDLLDSAVVGHEPADDGVAEPGMVVTVRYEADGFTDRLLMADPEVSCVDGLGVCSPRSPLGAALNGARVGERAELRLPGGDTAVVTLVGAVPYRLATRRAARDLRHGRPQSSVLGPGAEEVRRAE